MVIFFVIKIFFIVAIFSKAWLDVKGNKNQLDHIITASFEASILFVVILVHYWGYYSPIMTTGAWALLSYILLRYGLFDIFYNKLAHQDGDYLDTDDNNWLDRPKIWMRKMEKEKRLPLLSASRFLSICMGLLI